MNKNASVTMAAAMTVAGILTLAVLTMTIQHQAIVQAYNQGSSYDNNKQNKGHDTYVSSGNSNQKANGGDADGGHGGNANGGDASA